ncbi:MAG TPA: twin-arginine translocation signal domain-containing protein, partial [Saprospiraceae bacterium]|nr:twin-arginine translocation signal domain-containing protein [Saprospiraceae bacterium]
MDRKDFLKKTALAAGAVAAGATGRRSESTYQKLMQQVGFNHFPNQEFKTMQSVLHTADTRGHANHGWLDSHHTFSFANYYNPERV